MDEFEGIYWLGVAEACKYLSVSKRTLYNYMGEGKLTYYYIADTKTRRLKREDLDNLMVLADPKDDDDSNDK